MAKDHGDSLLKDRAARGDNDRNRQVSPPQLNAKPRPREVDQQDGCFNQQDEQIESCALCWYERLQAKPNQDQEEPDPDEYAEDMQQAGFNRGALHNLHVSTEDSPDNPEPCHVAG